MKLKGIFIVAISMFTSGSLYATTMVNSITLSGGVNLTGATLNGGTSFTSTNFDPVSSVVSENNQTDYDIFWRNGDTKPNDGNLDLLTGLNITTGILNPGNTGAGYINLFLSGLATSGVLIFNPDSATGSAESWAVSAIDGSGNLIGTTVNFAKQQSSGGANSVTDLGNTGTGFEFDRDSASNFTQNIYGIYIANSEFGLDSVSGIRITSDGGDPSLVVGVVPEPSGLLTLFCVTAGGLLSYRRRI